MTIWPPIITVIGPSTAIFIVSANAAAFRSSWLRKTGRAPDAPPASDMLLSAFGWGGIRFAFSGRHRAIGDRLLSVLVWVERITFLPLLFFFSYVLCVLVFAAIRR